MIYILRLNIFIPYNEKNIYQGYIFNLKKDLIWYYYIIVNINL
jgi:hypothetical protein